MKKLLAALIAGLLLFLFAPALGEATSFVFRGGVTWGMTLEEVMNLEDDSGEVLDGFAVPCLYFPRASVAGTVSPLGYFFAEDQLFLAVYESYDWGDDARGDLLSALMSLYGAPQRENLQYLSFLINALGGNLDSADFSTCLRFRAGEDTDVFYAAISDGGTMIAYLREDFRLSQLGLYNTEGL